MKQPLQRSQQSSNQRTATKKGGAGKGSDSGSARGTRARGDARNAVGVHRDERGNRVNVYEKQYRGNTRGKKSTDRDPNAVWLTRRTDKHEKGQEYAEMINSILRHHPHGEDDNDESVYRSPVGTIKHKKRFSCGCYR